MPGSSSCRGLATIARMVTVPVDLVDGDIGKFENPVFSVFRAIVEQHLDFGLLVLLLPAAELPFQLQEFGGGLTDIDIEGIELLDGGQGGSLLGGDQGSLRHQRFTDPAGDRSGDPGVIEVDAGILDGGLGGGHIGHGLFPIRLGLDLLLLAHRLGLDKGPVSAGLEAGGVFHGFAPGQRRLGAVEAA